MAMCTTMSDTKHHGDEEGKEGKDVFFCRNRSRKASNRLVLASSISKVGSGDGVISNLGGLIGLGAGLNAFVGATARAGGAVGTVGVWFVGGVLEIGAIVGGLR